MNNRIGSSVWVYHTSVLILIILKFKICIVYAVIQDKVFFSALIHMTLNSNVTVYN